ncbi:hypothetical protein SAMN02927921_01398 [Sinomicrobium oceani]|uniref:Uncharacterized protein n=1 Tax=Sinomicrobium oceani TaxID=1150368 RepID=A0A1K1NRQ0_9FLAO|nr:hypothetical protein [Sinomicrobium oceani]SFW37961.1 hypothetical protein SAMN02927921_01398 [Sinomicrobium oceani]
MNRHRALIDILLKKLRENTLSREEFERLAEIMNDPTLEGEVKYWMQEFWEDMELPKDSDILKRIKSKSEFDELRKRLEDDSLDKKRS